MNSLDKFNNLAIQSKNIKRSLNRNVIIVSLERPVFQGKHYKMPLVYKLSIFCTILNCFNCAERALEELLRFGYQGKRVKCLGNNYWGTMQSLYVM